MALRHPVAILGGTFDRLHVGHHALLEAAFSAGATVGVGLTTTRFLAAHPKPRFRAIESYRSRRAALVAYVRRSHPGRRWWLAPLDDSWGRSVDPGVDVIVVSAETERGARGVNEERRRRHLPPLRIRVVPLVLGADRLPVTSRRIRAGLIDSLGRRLRPVRVRISARAGSDVASARGAFRRAFPNLRFRWVNSGGSGSKRPIAPSSVEYSVSIRAGRRKGERRVEVGAASDARVVRRTVPRRSVEPSILRILNARARVPRR